MRWKDLTAGPCEGQAARYESQPVFTAGGGDSTPPTQLSCKSKGSGLIIQQEKPRNKTQTNQPCSCCLHKNNKGCLSCDWSEGQHRASSTRLRPPERLSRGLWTADFTSSLASPAACDLEFFMHRTKGNKTCKTKTVGEEMPRANLFCSAKFVTDTLEENYFLFCKCFDGFKEA